MENIQKSNSIIKKIPRVFSSIQGQAFFSVAINVLIFSFSIIRVFFFSKQLSVEQFGIMSLMLTISAFGTYYLVLGSFQYVFKSASNIESKYIAFKTSIALACLIFLVTSIAFVFIGDLVLEKAKLLEYKNVFILNMTSTFLMALLMLISFVRFGEMKNNEYNLIQFLRQVPWMLVCVLLHLFGATIDLQTVFIIINISVLFSILISIKKRDIRQTLTIKGYDFKGLFTYTLPLLPYYLSIWGIPLIIRGFIGIYLGYDQLSIFSISYTMIDIIFLFISSIISTLTPYFFNANEGEGSRELYNRMIKLSLIGTLFCLAGVLLLSKEIVLLMTSEKYLQAADYFVYLFPLALVKAVALAFEQFCLKQSLTKKLGIVYAISIALTFVCAKYGIQYFNVWGAVFASFVPQLITLIFLYPAQKSHFDVQLLKAGRVAALFSFFVIMVGIALVLDLSLIVRTGILILILIIGFSGFGLWDEKEERLLKSYAAKLKIG